MGDRIRNGLRLHQSSRANHATRQRAVVGIDDQMPAVAQSFEICLRRRMVPHVRVHRRRQHNSPRERQISRGEKVVGQAVCELRQQIRGRGSDHQNLILLGDSNVFDRARKSILGAGGGKQIRDYFASGERRECERANKLLRAQRVTMTLTEAPAPSTRERARPRCKRQCLRRRRAQRS